MFSDCGKSWKEDNVIRSVVVDKFEGGGGNRIVPTGRHQGGPGHVQDGHMYMVFSHLAGLS